ncbi:MAG: AP2 domain-containing protein [Pseudomonadota bacterium]
MKQIPLTKNQYALVDDEDYDWLMQWKWCVLGTENQYAIRGGRISDGDRRGKSILMHRELLNPDPEQQVDHINGNGFDNRRSNLRLCTPNQNRQHITIRQHGQYKGVRQHDGGGWSSYISHDNKQEYLGYYTTEEEAAAAYNKRAVELFGEFADLNYVKDIIPRPLGFTHRGTSGYYGVTWDKHRKKWKAKIRKGKKHVYLGRFDSAEEASQVVNEYLSESC